MNVGVPLEGNHETRVGLTPFGTATLVGAGHSVFVEHEAGLRARFSDVDYQEAGAQIAFSREEVYKRADLICRTSPLFGEDLALLEPGSTILSFHHLAVAPREFITQLMRLQLTLAGYEIIRDSEGHLPVLVPFSEIAGHLAVHVAAQYLQNQYGGRGVLVGNVPGIPPPTVLVLGAGAVGHAAARNARATGAHVIVMDTDLRKLSAIHREFPDIATVIAGEERIRRFVSLADAVIGAVLIPGARSPILVSEEDVNRMKPGSVIVDLSIDQGGCCETSRPTNLNDPVFEKHRVIHYCVPNMTACVARSGSRALANAALPYVMSIADAGIHAAVTDDAGLADGIYMYKGKLVNEQVGRLLDIEVTPIREALESDGAS